MKQFFTWLNEHPYFTAFGIAGLVIGITFLVKGNSTSDVIPEPEPVPDTPNPNTGRTRFVSRSGFRTVPSMGNSGVSGGRVNQGGGQVR